MTDEPNEEAPRVLPAGITDDYAIRIGRLIQMMAMMEMMLETLICTVTGLNALDGHILVSRLELRAKTEGLGKLLECRRAKLKPTTLGHWKIAERFLTRLRALRNWLAHGVLFPRGEDTLAVLGSKGKAPASAAGAMPITLNDLDNCLADASTALLYLGNVVRTIGGLDVPLPDKPPEPKYVDRAQRPKDGRKSASRPPRSSRR